MRSYTGSVSERILVKDSLYQTALPRFHMPDIPPLMIYLCELSTVFLQGRSCFKLHFSLILPSTFLPQHLPKHWGKMEEVAAIK